ncbi:MAG: DUF5071 domain-containing protein [Clostridia bacterium]|nr:DUF5071 domain-containing protein [Clostridia bacterium]
MSIGIDELFDMLSWNSDAETQKKGIELAKDIECFSVFLQPRSFKHSKDVWGNCAKILYDYPDEKLQYCVPEMLEWLEDMNWPGAELVLERLIKMKDISFLSSFLTVCVKEALILDNQSWLGNMAALLENDDLKNELPKDIRKVLEA